ncbi:MAG: hypothetical protein AAF610_10630 [Pseudomonadota bacterium]
MRTIKTRSVIGALMLSCLAHTSHAQNTGGVFPPNTPNDHQATQYRVTYDQETNALAQRVHYEATPNDEVMWRVVAQGWSAPPSLDSC